VARTNRKLETAARSFVDAHAAKLALGVAIAAAALISAASRHAFDAQLATLLALSAIMFACSCWIFCSKHPLKASPLAVLALLHTIALFGAPMFEDDHYRYLWDGFQTLQHGTPFGVIPEQAFLDSTLPVDAHEWLSGINNPELPTIYGPVPQYFFAGAHLAKMVLPWLSHEQCLRALLGGFHLLSFGYLLRSFKLQAHRFVWLYVLNPLLYKEVALTGHFDLLFAMPLLIWCLRTQSTQVLKQRSDSTKQVLKQQSDSTKHVLKQRSGSKVQIGINAILLAIAAATRISVIAIVPLLLWQLGLRRSIKTLLIAALLVVAMYLPLLPKETVSGEGISLSAFAQQWEFNAGWFALWQHAIGRSGAYLVSAAIGALWLLLIMRWTFKTDQSDHAKRLGPALAAVLMAMLLMGPVLNPWYWLWLLPLGFTFDPRCKSAQIAIAGMGLVLMLSYAHGLFPEQLLTAFSSAELLPYQVPAILLWTEHLALWCCAAFAVWQYLSIDRDIIDEAARS
jgi:hypothetical protein